MVKDQVSASGQRQVGKVTSGTNKYQVLETHHYHYYCSTIEIVLVPVYFSVRYFSRLCILNINDALWTL